MSSLRMLLAIAWLIAGAAEAFAGYAQIEVEDGGRLEGQVRLVGDIPTLPPQPVYTQTEICGSTVSDERLVVGEGGALANAVVYLRDVTAGKAIPTEPITIDNARCRFVPHVVAASAGQTLVIHNDDPFLHDAHARIGAKTLFNRAIVKDGTIREPLAEPGLIHMNCNVRHTWMQAYVFVGENPYHAVTGADGRFRIDGIPPGKYTVTIWHELVGSEDQPAVIERGKTTTLDENLHVTAPLPDRTSRRETTPRLVRRG